MLKRSVLVVLTLSLPACGASLVYDFSYTAAFGQNGSTSIVNSFSFQLLLTKFYTSAADDGPLPAFTPFTVTDTSLNTFTLTQGRADYNAFGPGGPAECFTFASASGTTFGNCGGGVTTGSILFALFQPPVSMTGGPIAPHIFGGNFTSNPPDYINGSPGTGTMSLTVSTAGVPEPSGTYLGITGLFGLACYALATSRYLRGSS